MNNLNRHPKALPGMKMTHTEIVGKLIGKIGPVGETNTDKERFENLVAMCNLVDDLIMQIHAVAISNKNSREMSCKRAADFAERFLDSIIVNS